MLLVWRSAPTNEMVSSRAQRGTSLSPLGMTIFGGFAPYISAWLIDRFQSPTMHSFYLIAAAVVSTAVIWTLKETAFDELA